MRRGAPHAVQVVDRFHLVHNLRQAREGFLIDHRPALQAAAIGTAMALAPLTPAPRREEALQPPRHAPWVALYEAMHTLHRQRIPAPTIARQPGISPPTVYAYLRGEAPPGPKWPQWQPSA